MTRTLVITVDRDNDLGLKTSIRGPVVGRRQVLTAALKLGIADPEESDTNAILGALSVNDKLMEGKSEEDEIEIAILTGDETHVHFVSFSSTIQKRVVSSTMKAESYQLTEVVEAADLIRAALCDVHGRLDEKDWESSAASWCKCLWLTDCKSAEATLHTPVTKGIDKRLGIELASLRQYLWRRRFQHLPDKRLLE